MEDEVDLPPEVMKRLYELKALQSEKDIVSFHQIVLLGTLENGLPIRPSCSFDSRLTAEFYSIFSILCTYTRCFNHLTQITYIVSVFFVIFSCFFRVWKVYEKYKTERAQLERKFASDYSAIYSRRAAIVTGRQKPLEGL